MRSELHLAVIFLCSRLGARLSKLASCGPDLPARLTGRWFIPFVLKSDLHAVEASIESCAARHNSTRFQDC